jgi:uncharacterized protein (UPF0216 family)
MGLRRDISDEPVMMRWMGIEISRTNRGMVTGRRPLSELLAVEEPSAKTKGGDPHYFDPAVLHRIAEGLPEDLHRKLRLPIQFYYTPDVPDSCFLADEAAVEALRQLGELSAMRTMVKGRCWVARAIAFAIMQQYPTAVQVVMGA